MEANAGGSKALRHKKGFQKLLVHCFPIFTKFRNDKSGAKKAETVLCYVAGRVELLGTLMVAIISPEASRIKYTLLMRAEI